MPGDTSHLPCEPAVVAVVGGDVTVHQQCPPGLSSATTGHSERGETGKA